MKKSIFFIISMLILVGCGVNESDSNESLTISATNNIISNSISGQIDGSQVSETSNEISDLISPISTSLPISVSKSAWSSEIQQQMFQVVGEEIPYINEFNQNYQYIVKMMTDSITPYINVYVENASNWINSYKTALDYSSYVYESEDLDDGVNWLNYYKTLTSESKLFIRFAYYYNEGKNWFDIYAYLDNGGGGGFEIPVDTDYTLTPNLFPANSYASGQQTLELGSLNLTYVDILCFESNQIQFKKGTARLFNSQAISPIDKIYLEDANNYGNFKVLAGTSISNLKEVSTYNGVYGLAGATYFEIKSANVNVGRVYSIQIVLQ